MQWDIPLTIEEAIKNSFSAAEPATCQSGLGVLWEHDDNDRAALALYFTPAGQLSGLRIKVAYCVELTGVDNAGAS